MAAAFLVLLAFAAPATLFGPGDPSSAADATTLPWFLMWLQALMRHFDSQIAGFYLPLFTLVGLFAVPYIGRRDTKLRVVAMAVFVLLLIVLTTMGFAGDPIRLGAPLP